MKRVKKLTVVLMALVLTFSSCLVAFAKSGNSHYPVGSISVYAETGTAYNGNEEYCYAKVESSWLVDIQIDGSGHNGLGWWDFSRYVDQDYGLVAGHGHALGFDRVNASYEVWYDDGHNSWDLNVN